MQHGIREFRPRQPLDRQLSSDTLNRILRELESLRISRVVNGTFRKLPGGTEITVAPQRGGGSTPATRQPWDLIAVPDPESEAENPPYKIRVQPGTLNGILPSNWDQEFTAQPTGLYYAKAIITTDGEAITGVTIQIDTSAPSLQTPQEFAIQTSVEYLFGLFEEGQVSRVIGAGHINLLPHQWLVLPSTPPASPGEPAYDVYYRLQ